MAWFTEPLEIRTDNGDGHSGRWRLTTTSDEDGGGPHGDMSHDHSSPEECNECDRCNDYVSRITGIKRGKALQAIIDRNEKEELKRLKKKHESSILETYPGAFDPIS